MDLHQWLAGITDDNAQDIAARANLPKRTVQHQMNTGRMSIENVIKIAAAYGHHPLRTLIEWGIVDPAWESVPDIEAALRMATEDQLGEEVLYRMKLNPGATVGDKTVDHLAARRRNTPMSTPDTDDVPHAARTAKLEPEEGDDDYGPGA